MADNSSTIPMEIEDTSKGDKPHVVILGAGASLAAFPQGDKNGRRLPLMNNLIEVVGLVPLLKPASVAFDGTDFEAIYADLFEDPRYRDLAEAIERRVYDYFRILKIPEEPTIYDHLVLSLRGKDLIATFNWDPLLFQACARNYQKIDLPKVAFLHGNVAVGYCEKDKTAGAFPRGRCRKCHKPFTRSRLLYPIKTKDYSSDPFIRSAWNDLNRWLKGAFMLTIFGYSGPASDVDALDAIRQAWGNPSERNLEQVEIIDLKEEDELRLAWDDLIHTHHYQTFTDFYDSWIARHPRRTCEAMWNQTQEIQFLDDNPIPRDMSFEQIWEWLEPLKKAESMKQGGA